MKRRELGTDEMFWMVNRGNLHVWRIEKEPRIPTMVTLWPNSGPFGQLEACRHSRADDAYWCRYAFSGPDVRESLGQGPPWPEQTGWYVVEPLKPGQVEMFKK